MPRPKLPKRLAEVTAADQKNPARYNGLSDPKVDNVGAAPRRLSDGQQKIWAEFVDDLPWLCRSDRRILELTCRLTARMQTDPEMGIAALAQLRLCLSVLGATPTDRGKVQMPDGDDPANEFIN